MSLRHSENENQRDAVIPYAIRNALVFDTELFVSSQLRVSIRKPLAFLDRSVSGTCARLQIMKIPEALSPGVHSLDLSCRRRPASRGGRGMDTGLRRYDGAESRYRCADHRCTCIFEGRHSIKVSHFPIREEISSSSERQGYGDV